MLNINCIISNVPNIGSRILVCYIYNRHYKFNFHCKTHVTSLILGTNNLYIRVVTCKKNQPLQRIKGQ